MNHRRSLRGYHSLRAVGTFGVVLLDVCAPVRASPLAAPQVVSSPPVPWRAERAAALAQILHRSVAEMLAEVLSNDGHRRSLLDPWVTQVGVWLAVRGADVRMTHEHASEVTHSWAAPPTVATSGTPVTLSGQLARPLQAEAVEVLWGSCRACFRTFSCTRFGATAIQSGASYFARTGR